MINANDYGLGFNYYNALLQMVAVDWRMVQCQKRGVYASDIDGILELRDHLAVLELSSKPVIDKGQALMLASMTYRYGAWGIEIIMSMGKVTRVTVKSKWFYVNLVGAYGDPENHDGLYDEWDVYNVLSTVVQLFTMVSHSVDIDDMPRSPVNKRNRHLYQYDFWNHPPDANAPGVAQFSENSYNVYSLIASRLALRASGKEVPMMPLKTEDLDLSRDEGIVKALGFLRGFTQK